MILNKFRRVYKKFQYDFMIEVLENSGLQGRYFNTISIVYKEHIAHIILNGKSLKQYFGNQEQESHVHACHFLSIF